MGLRVGVIGLGAWGSTLAALLSQQGHRVHGWSRRSGGEVADLLPGRDLVLVALSMAGLRDLAPRLAPLWPPGLPLISCTKGIDLDQLCTASQLWRHHGGAMPLLVLSGPNLAQELQERRPAATVLASEDNALAQRLQEQLSSDQLRLYTNADPIGTEVAGALKNVMAIAAGVCDGLGLGANAKASLLCRALVEMGSVSQALGGDPSSLYGLAGLGDLLATANSPLSRNYRFGLALAEGCSSEQALARVGATVEGMPTASAVLQLAASRGWSLPICAEVGHLIEGQVEPQAAVRRLMERQLRPEGVALRS
jgi:glycerol-3-phosphate dehydrogenase (NAD(P)+)